MAASPTVTSELVSVKRPAQSCVYKIPVQHFSLEMRRDYGVLRCGGTFRRLVNGRTCLRF